MHLLAGDPAGFDRYAEIQPELEQQFVRHVLFRAAFEDVALMREQFGFQLFGVRIAKGR